MFTKTYFFEKKKNMKFREIYADSDVFSKFYEMENVTGTDLVVIPDGSIDIQCVWKDGNLKIYVCGSVKNAKISSVSDFDKCFGARFHIGVLPNEIKNQLSEIINNRVDLENLMDVKKISEYLREDLLVEQKADILLAIFDNGIITEENVILNMLVEEIEKNKGNVNIADIIDYSGYSHRYVNYVFKNNIGLSIKKYASIVRLQESLTILLNGDEDTIYSELGYYDQAHFIKDFKNFTTITPNALRKNAIDMNFI